MIQFGVLFVWQKGRLQNLPSVLSKLSKAKLSLHLFGEQPSHPETGGLTSSTMRCCWKSQTMEKTIWTKKMKTKLV